MSPKLIATLGAALIIAGFLGWVWRVDHLRAKYHNMLVDVQTVLSNDAGRKVPLNGLPVAISLNISLREQYKRERDNARAVLRDQTEKVRLYEAESKRLKAISAAQVARVARLIDDRNHWIKAANNAATRTEKRSAEKELEECNAVLDDLYSVGF